MHMRTSCMRQQHARTHRNPLGPSGSTRADDVRSVCLDSRAQHSKPGHIMCARMRAILCTVQHVRHWPATSAQVLQPGNDVDGDDVHDGVDGDDGGGGVNRPRGSRQTDREREGDGASFNRQANKINRQQSRLSLCVCVVRVRREVQCNTHRSMQHCNSVRAMLCADVATADGDGGQRLPAMCVCDCVIVRLPGPPGCVPRSVCVRSYAMHISARPAADRTLHVSRTAGRLRCDENANIRNLVPFRVRNRSRDSFPMRAKMLLAFWGAPGFRQ